MRGLGLALPLENRWDRRVLQPRRFRLYLDDAFSQFPDDSVGDSIP